MVARRLEAVERLIRRRISDLDDQITAGTLDAEDVKQVEADAVLRIVRNPEGYLSESDGTYTYQLSRDATGGALEILASEWETLGVRPRRVFQIVPSIGGIS
jgi:hypothetical protein